MKRASPFLLVFWLAIAQNVFGQTLTCEVTLQPSAKLILDSHSPQVLKASNSDFFHFSINPGSSTEFLEHQNQCIKGKDFRPQLFKGLICLVVTSGVEASNIPFESSQENSKRLLTFHVIAQSSKNSESRSKKNTYIATESEVSLPVTSFRSNFDGRNAGFPNLALTCQ